MNLPGKLHSLCRTPVITRPRMLLALTIAVATDGLQLLFGPLGWAFADQIIDAVAMIFTVWLLGFHILLLPTFMVELIPVVDELPTWTACVATVIVLRRRGSPPPPA